MHKKHYNFRLTTKWRKAYYLYIFPIFPCETLEEGFNASVFRSSQLNPLETPINSTILLRSRNKKQIYMQ